MVFQAQASQSSDEALVRKCLRDISNPETAFATFEALCRERVDRILPWLTPLAATGLMIVAGSATGMHLSRGETSSGILTAVLFILLAFVAYMRWKVNLCQHEPWLEGYDVQRRSRDGRLWAGIGVSIKSCTDS
jgi:DoxX-like family